MSFKFNPITAQLDLVGSGSSGSNNFSYYNIPFGSTVTVPDGQEMLLVHDLMVSGNLMVDGYVTQLPDADSGLSWSNIPVDVNVKIPVNRIMFYRSPLLVVGGNLRVNGDLLEV